MAKPEKPADVRHQGETVQEFLKRGGKIKQVQPGVAVDAISGWPSYGNFGRSRKRTGK